MQTRVRGFDTLLRLHAFDQAEPGCGLLSCVQGFNSLRRLQLITETCPRPDGTGAALRRLTMSVRLTPRAPDGLVTQWTECSSTKAEVGGSSPPKTAIISPSRRIRARACDACCPGSTPGGETSAFRPSGTGLRISTPEDAVRLRREALLLRQVVQEGTVPVRPHKPRSLGSIPSPAPETNVDGEYIHQPRHRSSEGFDTFGDATSRSPLSSLPRGALMERTMVS